MLSYGPANGDLAAGLEGWGVQGREAPTPLGPGVRLPGNTTLVSPPLAVPAGAQTLRITARAPSGGALMLVSARPEAGGPDVALGALELGDRRRSLPLGAAAIAGTTVRIVLDPVPALGTSLEVLRVGPVTAPLPRWTLERGTLEVVGARGRRTVRVADEPLSLASGGFRPPPRARWLTVGVRGEGLIRASAGGRRAAARAGGAWRTVRVPLPARRRAGTVLRLTAIPGPGGLQLRDLGVAERPTARTPGRSGGSGSR